MEAMEKGAAPKRGRAIQWLSNTVLRATTESRSSPIGHITLDRKQAGKPSARNGHARFEAAGTENQLTVRLVRHSQRKRGATDRSDLRSLASVLDPTDRGDGGNVGIIRSPLRATVLPDCGGREVNSRPYRDCGRGERATAPPMPIFRLFSCVTSLLSVLRVSALFFLSIA